MKKLYLYLLAIISFVLYGCKYEVGTIDYAPMLQTKVDSVWQNYTKQFPNNKGGLGVYIDCPKGKFFLSSGLEEGASADSRFRAACITKSFTATAIMWLDQQRKLNIEDTLTSYIPGTTETYLPNDSSYQIPYKNRITIRELLEHRANIYDITISPIPDTINAWYAGKLYCIATLQQEGKCHQFTLDEIHGVISKHQLSYGLPGIEHHYSNNGYTLLAKIIERVSGKSYERFVTDEIILKNNLSRTSLPCLGNDTVMQEPYLKGYMYQNNSSIDYSMYNMSWANAEGNIVTSFRDIARFYRNLFLGNTCLNIAQAKRMKVCTPSNNLYGLGIEFDQGLGYGHTGGHFGYQTIANYDVATDFAVVSVSTLYLQNPIQNKDQQKMIEDLLKKLKRSMGYK